jgi:hypothetical protein
MAGCIFRKDSLVLYLIVRPDQEINKTLCVLAVQLLSSHFPRFYAKKISAFFVERIKFVDF